RAGVVGVLGGGRVTMRRCKMVTVAVVDEDGAAARVTLPSYTVDPDLLLARVGELAIAYLAAAERDGSLPSLADLALFFVAPAARRRRRVRRERGRRMTNASTSREPGEAFSGVDGNYNLVEDAVIPPEDERRDFLLDADDEEVSVGDWVRVIDANHTVTGQAVYVENVARATIYELSSGRAGRT